MFTTEKLDYEWAKGIMKRMRGYFGEKFDKQWASVTENGNNPAELIETMQEVFAGLNEAEIARGLNTMRSKTFVPSLPEFRSWCQPKPKDEWLTVEQAWSIAIDSMDDAKTVIWCDEIAQALTAVESLLDMGDKFSAARAFKDHYAGLVERARAEFRSPKMYASLGDDKEHRIIAVEHAQQTGMLKLDQKTEYETVGYLKDFTTPIAENVASHIAAMKANLGVKTKTDAEMNAEDLARVEAAKRKQIATLEERITRHLDPYDDKEDYLDSIRNEPTQQLNYGRINK